MSEKLNTDAYNEDSGLIDEIRDKLGSSRKEALHVVCNAYRGVAVIRKVSCSEKKCRLYGDLDSKGKVMCVAHRDNKLPTIKHYSLEEAQACSQAPTLISMAEKEPLMEEIKNANQMKQYWKDQCEKAREHASKEIEKLKRPNQELLTENNTLNSRCAEMQNAFSVMEAKKNEELAALETDHNQLKQRVEEMSHDPLVEKNISLMLQRAEDEKTIEDLKQKLSTMEFMVKVFKTGNSI
jgi:predicted RNase H-like nuclease (RuvC/YqgF family)